MAVGIFKLKPLSGMNLLHSQKGYRSSKPRIGALNPIRAKCNGGVGRTLKGKLQKNKNKNIFFFMVAHVAIVGSHFTRQTLEKLRLYSPEVQSPGPPPGLRVSHPFELFSLAASSHSRPPPPLIRVLSDGTRVAAGHSNPPAPCSPCSPLAPTSTSTSRAVHSKQA